ncbi:MAG: DUF2269 family protein [Micromonosporaceae bacterium]|nr:DUF2269 family protein [Micromonosporaceae bacterium]
MVARHAACRDGLCLIAAIMVSMATLIVTLHVLTAIFLIGPLALAPFVGLRAVVRRDPDGVRRAAGAAMVLGASSGLVFLLGLAATGVSRGVSYSTPWVTISITLSVIALGAVLAVATPALRSVAAIIEDGAADSDVKARMDSLRGRIGASAGLAALSWAVVATLMVTKPFS